MYRLYIILDKPVLYVFLTVSIAAQACSSDSNRNADEDATVPLESRVSLDTDASTEVDTGLDDIIDTGTVPDEGDKQVNGDLDLDSGMQEEFEHVYEVGEERDYADPSEVPWESLQEGSLIRIHYRTAPYADKWVINTVATERKPLVVRGIPQDGKLPVITGENAKTREQLSFWNEERSVIKIGGSNLPTDEEVPAHIRVENLDIRSARPAFRFTDDSGNSNSYSENAAAIHVEIGEHITIRNCILHDSGNGFFSGHQSSDLLLEANYIYDNGIEGSIYHHNNYTESFAITFQYNRFGPLRAGCLGNNLKDRSAGTVIRYNWIESGNRQLDLVESDYPEFVSDPSYQETFVYGNILIEPEGAGNSQIIHYGGDGDDQSMYRRGTLYFYNNTLVSTRSGNTTLIRVSTNDVHADMRNNVFYTTAGGEYLAICTGTGNIELTYNWLPFGYRETHEPALQGTVRSSDNLEGTEPGFEDLDSQDFQLKESSPCIGAGNTLNPQVLPDHDITQQYKPHRSRTTRQESGAPSMGAFGQS